MSGRYDLEERTKTFAKDVRAFVRKVPETVANTEDCKQLVKSSGSVGANYIEANEHLSDDDFLYRIKVCRKEAKESRYWLELLHLDQNGKLDQIREKLIQEATELMKIFGSIVQSYQEDN